MTTKYDWEFKENRGKKMAKNKHKEFNENSDKGELFIKMWNKADRDGIQQRIAEEFGISVASVYRIRKKLGLSSLHSKEHPGRSKLIKRIKRLYWKGKSSVYIGRYFNLSTENVRKILISEKVEMNEQFVTNPLNFPFKNNVIGHQRLLDLLKKEYEEGNTIVNLSKKYNIDQRAISLKLRAMGVKIKTNNRMLPGGYPCKWCAEIMDEVKQNKGLRKQLYCSSKCKNMIRDFKKMHKCQIKKTQRYDDMFVFLKNKWKDKYEEQLNKILGGKKSGKEERDLECKTYG